MKAEKQLYLENHTTHEDETFTITVGKDLWIPMILGYCIAGDVHGKKIRKSTIRSLMEQPTPFSATPLSAQGSYGDEYQVCSI